MEGVTITITAARMARHPVVRADIRRRGKALQKRAAETLAGHRHAGHAAVEGFMGKTDYNVDLTDERGQGAAMSIEFGRRAGSTTLDDGRVVKWGVMEGLHILGGSREAAAGESSA